MIYFDTLGDAASLKTLPGKTQWDKNHGQGKKSTVRIFSP
jgi:hypothetical protein